MKTQSSAKRQAHSRGNHRKRLLRNLHRKTQERHRRHLRVQYMLAMMDND